MVNNFYRTSNIRNPPIIDLLSQHSLLEDVISLGQGIPFFGPPPVSINAIMDQLDNKISYEYTADAGLISLRNVIMNKLKNENNIVVDEKKNIVVTSGANQGFMNAILTITNPGDEIILFAPTYFNYVMGVQLAGCKPVIIPTNPSNYLPDLNTLHDSITQRTKAIVTISPNNPSGQVYPKPVLKAINDFCKDQKLFHISDEVYEYFVFKDKEHISPFTFDDQKDHTISLFSCSKSFGISGYRIGYMIIPEFLFNEVLKVQDTIGISASSLGQIAASAAITLGKTYFDSYKNQIEEIRSYFHSQLQNVSTISYCEPNGAMYFYIKMKTNKKSIEISKRLIQEFKIITIPSEAFDDSNPCLRISFGNLPIEKSIIGLNRLIQGLKSLL